MKVLIYAEATRLISKSGIGTAYKHQIEAVRRVGLDYTSDWEDEYDIAHVNTLGPGAKMVVQHCKRKNIPVIWHVHTTAEDIRNSFIFSNFYARISRRSMKKKYATADHLIFPTHYTESVIRRYGIQVPGTVISNGVDTAMFKKNEEKARHFKEKFNIKGPLVLGVGFPFKRKGIHDFVDVARRMKDLTFIWFGARITTVLPRDVREILKNPPKNVIFPGFISQEELVGAYSAADLFFFPSYEENEGIVVLEALSCECPVVVRDIPVYRDWLQHGVNCMKGHSNEEFEEIINTLISNKDLARKIASGGREVALQRDLSEIGKMLLKTYESVLGRCKG
ncbi:MAG TPA: glycosyltransferase family 4 protein [Pseudothermotoga sp.]|nr:glycosyltransferase family 4 protein [Pseudothermotoga sp.]HOK83784.1 glycosyltransferase family 4 protein [Pseudothermotoga sp.]HPP70313.1 glycosyltransferase family 4 protein [Pseudothermotoga sp.]